MGANAAFEQSRILALGILCQTAFVFHTFPLGIQIQAGWSLASAGGKARSRTSFIALHQPERFVSDTLWCQRMQPATAAKRSAAIYAPVLPPAKTVPLR